LTYTYDELNRLYTVTNWLNQTATYSYDAAGRLTSLTHFNGTVTTYGYDNANRLMSQSSAVASYQFTLDGNGNRTNIGNSGDSILNFAETERKRTDPFFKGDKTPRITRGKRGDALNIF
jgi:YD repeat-containing protein